MAGIASLFTREFFEGARGPAGAGRRAVPVGAHLRHQQRRPAIDRRHVPVGVSRRHAVAGRRCRRAAGRIDRAARRPHRRHRRRDGSGPGVAADLAVGRRARPVRGAPRCSWRRATALKAWANGAPLADRRSIARWSSPARAASSAPRATTTPSALRELAAPQPEAGRRRRGARRPRPPEDWRDRGLMFLKADAHRPAYDDFARALEPNPDDAAALDGLIRAAAALDNRIDDAQAPADQAGVATRRTRPPSWRCRGCWPRRATSKRRSAFPSTCCRRTPATSPALEQLASVLSDIGDAERLEPVVARLVDGGARRTPGRTTTPPRCSSCRTASTWRCRRRGTRWRSTRRNAKAHNLIGACLATHGPARRGPDGVRGVDQGRPARARDLHEPRDARTPGRQPRSRACSTSPRR